MSRELRAERSTEEKSGEAERALRFRQNIERATRCFRQKDYECALAEYQQAYEVNPRPPLLFNMAQIHRKAGHVRAALGLYERFLREDPHSKLAEEVRDYVKAIRESEGGTDPRSTDENSTDNFVGTEEERQILFRKFVEEGVAKFKAGEFDAAVSAYWAAYGLRAQPIIIFNVAQVYRKTQNWSVALTLFERFLKQEPRSVLAGEVEAHITEARERLRARQNDADRRTVEQVAKANAILAERLAEVRELDRQIQALAPKPKPIYKRAWLWVLLGSTVAVGVALGVGLGVGLQQRLPTSDLGNLVFKF